MKKLFVLSTLLNQKEWRIVERVVHSENASAYMLYHDYLRCDAPDELKSKIRLLDDLLIKEDYDAINKEALRWATGWYRGESLSSVLTFQGLNLGELIVFPICNFVSALLRIKTIITKLYDIERPDEIHVFLREWEPTNLVIQDNAPLVEYIAISIAQKRKIGINAAKSRLIYSRLRKAFRRIVPHLRNAKRKSLILKAKAQNTPLDIHSDNCDEPVQGPAAFVMSAHSVFEIAAAYSRLGFGRSYYIGLNSKLSEPAQKALFPEVKFVDLYSQMPIKLSSFDKKFLAALIDGVGDNHDCGLRRTDGSDCDSYLQNMFSRMLQNYFRTEGYWLLQYINAAKKVLSLTKAETVFADNGLQIIERIFFLLGRKRNVLTIESAHSLRNNLFELCFPKYFISDYYFVWGNHDRQLLESLGADPDVLEETGVGRFADYIQSKKIERPVSKIRIGVTCDKEHKFYGITGYGNMREKDHFARYSRLIELAKTNKNIVLSFKFRPSIEENYYLLRLLEQAGIQDFEVFRNIDTPQWMQSLSMLVTDFSTMGLEAMIFDVPILIHQSHAVGDSIGYESSGAVDIIVPDLSNLSELVYSVSRNPSFRSRQRAEFVESAIGDISNTHPAERTATAINNKYRRR